jgi:hypothetical protein
MTTTNTLRKSGVLFSERYGVPAHVNYYQWMERSTGVRVVTDRKLLSWVPREEPSNCPILASNMRRFAKSAPWQLHSVARNVFAGRIPAAQAGAMALSTFGQPPFVIVVSDGLYTAADQCVHLWETSTRLLVDGVMDLDRGFDARDAELRLDQAIKACGIEDRAKKVVDHLRHTLRDGDLTPLMHLNVEDIKLPVLGVPDGQLRHRPQRQFLWHQFVIAHELVHIILGHLGPTGSPAASKYTQDVIHGYRTLSTWDNLTDDSQRAEAAADLFGFFEFCYATSWEIKQRKGVKMGWRDRSELALLVQHLEGAAIATLVFYLLSALGVPECHTSTHPHPDHRFALITEAVLSRMKTIISTTNEPNEGFQHYPSGFYERVMFLATVLIPVIYQATTGLLETILHRQR